MVVRPCYKGLGSDSVGKMLAAQTQVRECESLAFTQNLSFMAGTCNTVRMTGKVLRACWPAILAKTPRSVINGNPVSEIRWGKIEGTTLFQFLAYYLTFPGMQTKVPPHPHTLTQNERGIAEALQYIVER